MLLLTYAAVCLLQSDRRCGNGKTSTANDADDDNDDFEKKTNNNNVHDLSSLSMLRTKYRAADLFLLKF